MNTVFVDVDGVLLDYNKPFVKHWNEGIDSGLYTGAHIMHNPVTWTFGLTQDDDQSELDRATMIFHDTHTPLPLLHPGVVDGLRHLYSKYNVEILSSYPDLDKRKHNLDLHNLVYHNINCNIQDKLSHINAHVAQGNNVVCIIEDGPHHIDKLLPEYAGKVWSPNMWNYLKDYLSDPRIRFYSNPVEWCRL